MEIPLSRRFFEHLQDAQEWVVQEAQAGTYRPKDPLWNTLAANKLQNGYYAKIRYHTGKLGYVASVFRSPYWEEKVRSVKHDR